MIDTSWESFKLTIDLGFVYKDHGDHYDLLTIDGRATWTCIISKTTPENNDQLDFETNYKHKALTNALDIMNRNTEKTSITDNANTVDCKQTTITTSATKIELNCEAKKIRIKHTSDTTVWIGKDSTITAGGTTVYPLAKDEVLEIILSKNNDNNFYGIVSAGTATIYVLTTYKEP